MPHADIPQGRIDYLEHGEGRPVVFVHGYLMGGELWQDLAAVLAPQGFRCLMPTWPLGAHRTAMTPGARLDAPGQAAIIAAFLDALDLDDVVLVGNDSGGALSQVVATKHPERLGALVLTNCDCFDNFPPSFFKALVQATKVPGALKAALAPMKTAAARRSPLGYGLLSDTDLDHLTREWVKPAFADAAIMEDLKQFTLGLRKEVTEQAARDLASFDRPTLFAWATDDRLFPLEHAHRLAAIIPDDRVETLPGKAFSMVDQPDQLGALIAGFATESAPRGIDPTVSNLAAS